MNLYNLSARYQQLLDQDEYSAEELDELGTLSDTIENECINRGKYIRNLEAEANAIANAVEEMEERQLELENKAERQREKLAIIMQENQIEKITSSPLFPVRVRLNPVSVEILDKQLILADYKYMSQPQPTEMIDKRLIKECIEKGIQVHGARLVQKLRIEFK